MSWRFVSSIAAFLAILFITACQSDESLEFKRYYSSGALVYQQHCQNCHGTKGEGLSALIPPLSDSTYLRKNILALPCYIKNGLKGQIIISGKTFEDVMPANDLSPVEISQVLTYIGNSFGNKLSTIDEQSVQKNLAGCK
ncbi:cytochrome c [Mucilaginibacter sp. BT774]|uniref:c-type cytochrome n=1 Tax=Mucilaginibacter sp. BT774 TaxID=3062276 RepID=UPI0026762E5F|nr:cytochrome c [Mucilaginibacter sp. BT774]MDO3625146.1 cytochrome c [Mucilaginibacter sp. BT774]